MKNLSVAYAINKRNKMAKGGMIRKEMMNDTQMCAHGGPAMCAEGCYVENPKLEESEKMADGGMVEEDLDLDSDMDDSMTSQVLNEDDNPMGMSEDESGEMGKPKKSKLLGRILGALRMAHLPDRADH